MISANNLENILRRLTLSFTGACLIMSNVFAGSFSTRKVQVVRLDDVTKKVAVHPGAEYSVTKSFSDGTNVMTKVSRTSRTVQFWTNGGNIVRYDMLTPAKAAATAHPRVHLNVTGKKPLNMQNNPSATKVFRVNRMIPKTPSRFKGQAYELKVRVDKGKIVHKTSKGTRVIRAGAVHKFPVDPKHPRPNTLHIGTNYTDDVVRGAVNLSDDAARIAVNYSDDAARLAVNYSDDIARAAQRAMKSAAVNYSDDAARAALSKSASVALSDGPQVVPLDVLSVVLLGVELAQLYFSNEPTPNELYWTEHYAAKNENRLLRIHFPEIFKESPYEIDLRTGETIIKNPRDYYAHLPQATKDVEVLIKRSRGTDPDYRMSKRVKEALFPSNPTQGYRYNAPQRQPTTTEEYWAEQKRYFAEKNRRKTEKPAETPIFGVDELPWHREQIRKMVLESKK